MDAPPSAWRVKSVVASRAGTHAWIRAHDGAALEFALGRGTQETQREIERRASECDVILQVSEEPLVAQVGCQGDHQNGSLEECQVEGERKVVEA